MSGTNSRRKIWWHSGWQRDIESLNNSDSSCRLVHILGQVCLISHLSLQVKIKTELHIVCASFEIFWKRQQAKHVFQQYFTASFNKPGLTLCEAFKVYSTWVYAISRSEITPNVATCELISLFKIYWTAFSVFITFPRSSFQLMEC